MTVSQAVVLALIQGITEFLPISSSAHLILVPYLLGWQGHDIHFDVVTNAGTLLAAVVYFRRDLQRVWQSLRPGLADPAAAPRRPALGPAVAVASLPVLVVGLVFYGWLTTSARHPVLIASTSIGFGLLLWWADRAGARTRELGELRWRDAAVIGLAQALALVPGTSRSGITITAGLFLGFTREEAARFSFLLAIPVGVAALVHDLYDLALHTPPHGKILPLLIGFAVSAVSAFLVIDWLLAWLRRQNMALFVVYRVVLGVVILALVLV